MQFHNVIAILGLAAGLTTAAPISANIEIVKTREPQYFDLTYVDKRDAKAEAKADAQYFDLTYVDKRDAKAEAKADAQYFDLTYVDKA